MFFKYTLFKVCKDQILEMYPVGINISFMHHAKNILYTEADTEESFDYFIQHLQANANKNYSKHSRHGEKAKVVMYNPNVSMISYSSDFFDRIEQAQITNLVEIENFVHHHESLRCLIFDINSNHWSERRYTQQLDYYGLIEPLKKQIALF